MMRRRKTTKQDENKEKDSSMKVSSEPRWKLNKFLAIAEQLSLKYHYLLDPDQL